MSFPRLSVRISPLLLERLESFVDQHNLTVSEGVIAAIASYVGNAEEIPLVERMRLMEDRVTVLKNNIFIP